MSSPSYNYGDNAYGTNTGSTPDITNESKRKGKKDKDNKLPTKKSSRSFILAFVVLAIVGVAVLVLTSKPSSSLYVVRSSQSLNAFSHPTDANLEVVKVNKNDIVDGAASASTPEAAKSLAVKLFDLGSQTSILTFPLPAHQQLVPAYFGTSASPLSVALKANERLISIHASAATALAGGLQPGDSVDIAAATSGNAGIIASNIKIVAIGTDTSGVNTTIKSADGTTTTTNNPDTALPNVYVIKVSSDKVVALALADSADKLYLIYRAPGSSDITTNSGVANVFCAAGVSIAGVTC